MISQITPHQIQTAIERAIFKLSERKLELYNTDKEVFYKVLDNMVIDELECEHEK